MLIRQRYNILIMNISMRKMLRKIFEILVGGATRVTLPQSHKLTVKTSKNLYI